MTKQLLIMRHAKSSWSDGSVNDHQRVLNKRGLHDAPRMGQFIAEQGLTPDWIASSTAKRARLTAELFAENCQGFDDSSLEFVEEFYHGSPTAYLNYLSRLKPKPDQTCKTVLIVGHNPGLESLVFHLARHYESMPTAAIACFHFDLDDWANINESLSKAKLISVWRPKEI